MLARKGQPNPVADLLQFADKQRFATVLADPPWQLIGHTFVDSVRAGSGDSRIERALNHPLV